MEPMVEREIVLPVPPDEVWEALTRGDRLSAWFGAEAQIEARPGTTATFRWPDGTERRALVEVVEAPGRLRLRWLPFMRSPDGRVGPHPSSRVEFRCAGVAEGTRLTVTEMPSDARGVRRSDLEGVRA